jgi:hypothetical protein
VLERLQAIDAALLELDPPARPALAGPALVQLCRPALGLDEDDVEAATRRGLLLAAAGGDPTAGLEPDGRAALETASELADVGLAAPLAAALADLAVTAARHRLTLAAAALDALAGDQELALRALAVVLLAEALAG